MTALPGPTGYVDVPYNEHTAEQLTLPTEVLASLPTLRPLRRKVPSSFTRGAQAGQPGHARLHIEAAGPFAATDEDGRDHVRSQKGAETIQNEAQPPSEAGTGCACRQARHWPATETDRAAVGYGSGIVRIASQTSSPVTTPSAATSSDELATSLVVTANRVSPSVSVWNG